MSCRDCQHYSEERSGYEYGDYIEAVACDINPTFANLKSFPFKKKQPCFRLNFWLSHYADNITDDEENNTKVFLAYRRDKDPQKARTDHDPKD